MSQDLRIALSIIKISLEVDFIAKNIASLTCTGWRGKSTGELFGAGAKLHHEEAVARQKSRLLQAGYITEILFPLYDQFKIM